MEHISSHTNRRLWYLYDFANSIILVGILYYFSLWAVAERGASQWIVSLPVSLATIVLLVFMPYVARKADKKNTHKGHMLLWSTFSGLCVLALSLFGDSMGFYTLFIVYFLFNIFFQSGYIFYSSLLHRISDSNNRSHVSGIGQAWGQAGNLAGVLLSFATLHYVMVATNNKLNVFFWSTIVFLLLLIPISKIRTGTSTKELAETESEIQITEAELDVQITKQEVQGIIAKLKKHPQIARFLIAYALYSDAVLTITLFISLYLKKVVFFSDTQIKYASVILLVSTLVGGLLSSKIVRHKNRWELQTLLVLLCIWPIAICLFAFLSAPVAIYLLITVLGMTMSIIYAVSRSYFSMIIPRGEQAEFFSIFVVFERVGGIFGPILWSLVVSTVMFFMGQSAEGAAYRIAIVTVGLITAVGYFALRKVSEPRRGE